MHANRLLTTVLASLGFVVAHDVAADDFDVRRREAERNMASEAGTDYDRWLGDYFRARPEVGSELTDCVSRHAETPPLRGYIEFDRGGGYRYVLRPKGPFADCVAKAFEGFAPPPPPTLPYVNPFELNITSPRTGD